MNSVAHVIAKIIEAILGAFSGPQAPPSKVHDTYLIRKWEGCELKAYKDTGGVWTIGYGHTKTAKPGMRITEEVAEELLRGDLDWVEDVINSSVQVPINQVQYDVLASFVYNIGGTQFRNSTLLRKLNAYDYAGVTKEFLRWKYDNGRMIQGLLNRREEEAATWEGAITDEQRA